MISVSQNTKLYILCPANRVTGGTELAHQLVDYLIFNRKDAYIVYYNQNKIVLSEKPIEFKKYNVIISSDIDDNSNNIIVLPEVSFSFASIFTSIQIIFWWMSVDNYFTKSNFIDYIKFFKLYDVIKLIYIRILNNQNIFKGLSLYELKKVKNKNIHVYQSAYAKHFLLKNSFVDIMPLTDYINTDFSISIDLKMNKENIILYNRAKGYRLTRKIIKKLPELTFIPLANFTRVQLSELFARSKVYIDFGNHPGKDRMPREAVLNNCCVIVGKNGAANFFEDIPILNRYKIANTDIDEIVKSIKYCINNYDDANNDFDFYRKTILNEKEKFYQEINSIFNLNRLNP